MHLIYNFWLQLSSNSDSDSDLNSKFALTLHLSSDLSSNLRLHSSLFSDCTEDRAWIALESEFKNALKFKLKIRLKFEIELKIKPKIEFISTESSDQGEDNKSYLTLVKSSIVMSDIFNIKCPIRNRGSNHKASIHWMSFPSYRQKLSIPPSHPSNL